MVRGLLCAMIIGTTRSSGPCRRLSAESGHNRPSAGSLQLIGEVVGTNESSQLGPLDCCLQTDIKQVKALCRSLNQGKKVQEQAVVYVAGVLEYIAMEVIFTNLQPDS